MNRLTGLIEVSQPVSLVTLGLPQVTHEVLMVAEREATAWAQQLECPLNNT